MCCFLHQLSSVFGNPSIQAPRSQGSRSMVSLKTVVWFLQEAGGYKWHADWATQEALKLVYGKPEFRKGESIPFRYGGVSHFKWQKSPPEQEPEPKPVEPVAPVAPVEPVEPGAEPNVPELEGEITNS